MGNIPIDDAVISACGEYRYFLRRRVGKSSKTLAFIMLNPSTADASTDDPTIRRCRGFCSTLGYGELRVVNLFALRATDPSELRRAKNPVGIENLEYIKKTVQNSDMTICAWGVKGSFMNQDRKIFELLKDNKLYTLKVTKNGHPCHPLYLKSDLKPVLFQNNH